MQNIKEEVDFFDGYVEKADQYDVFDDDGWLRILGLFDSLLKPIAGGKVIDLGCGTGSLSSRLAAKGMDVVGIDVSPKAIESAVRNSRPESRCRFLIGNIEKLPFPDNCFDIVVLGAVLHHFPDFSGVAREAYRVLKKGGAVFGFDPNCFNPITWVYRGKMSPFRSKRGLTANERLLGFSEIRQALEKTGFRVELRAFSGITYRFIHDREYVKFLTLYNSWEKCFSKSIFSRWFGSFVFAWGRK